jgi:hypothetical protein
MALNAQEAFENKTQAKKNIKDAISAVAKDSRQHPDYLSKMLRSSGCPRNLSGRRHDRRPEADNRGSAGTEGGRPELEEAAVMRFLQARLQKK